MGMPSLLRKVFLVDLLQGLKVTFRYQDPKEIYTEQYPLSARRRPSAIWRALRWDVILIPMKPCVLPVTCVRWLARSISSSCPVNVTKRPAGKN